MKEDNQKVEFQDKCFACEKSPRCAVLWKAVPENWIGHKDSYAIYAVTECNHLAHTELVGIFSSYLHDAKRNAESVCEEHNKLVKKVHSASVDG